MLHVFLFLLILLNWELVGIGNQSTKLIQRRFFGYSMLLTLFSFFDSE